MSRVEGEPLGCLDTAPPERWDVYVMSRAVDLLDDAEALDKLTGGPAQGKLSIRDEVIKALPESLRFEMTWSKWRYVSKK